MQLIDVSNACSTLFKHFRFMFAYTILVVFVVVVILVIFEAVLQKEL